MSLLNQKDRHIKLSMLSILFVSQGFASTDYNNDGLTDIAFHKPVASSTWNTLPVLFSKGDGTWNATNKPVPGWAHQDGVVAISGDYNKDGLTDIAFHKPIAGSTWNTLPILFSKADGTWDSSNKSAPSWAHQEGVVAISGDYNNDGRTDIAFHKPIAGSTWKTAPVLFSKGDGTWNATNKPAPGWAHQEGAIAINGGLSIMNPALNSAISAHGNTDWHIDTANEFLFGTDMSGAVSTSNHVPNTWTKRHMHVGLTNTSKYYYDKTKATTGDDINPSSGIDNAMLFFYAGHGSPTGWDTLGDSASQGKMLLSNAKKGGNLRYFWQCSCDVFAHGPRTCAGASDDYACPQDFSGAADSYAMRNIFERWGPALGGELRMACGMSTLAYCHESNVSKVWDNFNNNGMSVAESFIDGFGDWGVVPICITTGGSNIVDTPLYDTAFTNQPNTSGNTHYHIRFVAGTGAALQPSDSTQIPDELVRYKVAAADIHPRLLNSGPTRPLVLSGFSGGNAMVRIESESGAVYLKATQPTSPTETAIEEREYLLRATSLLQELGWVDDSVGVPMVRKIGTASMPIGGAENDIKQGQEGALITYKRQIEVQGKLVDVLGEGGVIRVKLSSDGLITAANRIWRKLEPTSVVVKTKSFDEALNEATDKLDKSDAYKLDQWKFGYKEATGNIKQEELQIVYQFAFVPKNRDDMMSNPPRIIELSAEKE